MKYSIYVRNRIKASLLREEPNIDRKLLDEKANAIFHKMLAESEYERELSKLSDDDPLKKLELEDEETFLDIHPGAEKSKNVQNRHAYLYHGVRFDDDHSVFANILKDEAIKCGKDTPFSYRAGGDNCNEGEYVSLTHYTGDSYDLEFKTFIEENVSFIISPLLNPLKCKYLPFEEWEKIKSKLKSTRHRYSYARNEYQYKKEVSLDYAVGILYPFKYYCHIKGYYTTKEDFKRVRELLIRYGYAHLPILDPTNNFEDISYLYDQQKFLISRPSNILR